MVSLVGRDPSSIHNHRKPSKSFFCKSADKQTGRGENLTFLAAVIIWENIFLL